MSAGVVGAATSPVVRTVQMFAAAVQGGVPAIFDPAQQGRFAGEFTARRVGWPGRGAGRGARWRDELCRGLERDAGDGENARPRKGGRNGELHVCLVEQAGAAVELGLARDEPAAWSGCGRG